MLTNDPGMGVIRHVDAGYERAAEVARERGVRIPMGEPCAVVSVREIVTVGHPALREPAPVDLSLEESPRPRSKRSSTISSRRCATPAARGSPRTRSPRLRRIAVAEVGENPRYPYKPPIELTVMVNPTIEPLGGETFEVNEGCLSVPAMRGVLERAREVRVRYLDREGEPHEEIRRGLTAGTFQHEVDHLDGILFLDRVSDPRTFMTWEQFERHHRDAFVERAGLVARFGS